MSDEWDAAELHDAERARNKYRDEAHLLTRERDEERERRIRAEADASEARRNEGLAMHRGQEMLAEVERLREALTKIEGVQPRDYEGMGEWAIYQSIAAQCKKLARAALAQPSGGDA